MYLDLSVITCCRVAGTRGSLLWHPRRDAANRLLSKGWQSQPPRAHTHSPLWYHTWVTGSPFPSSRLRNSGSSHETDTVASRLKSANVSGTAQTMADPSTARAAGTRSDASAAPGLKGPARSMASKANDDDRSTGAAAITLAATHEATAMAPARLDLPTSAPSRLFTAMPLAHSFDRMIPKFSTSAAATARKGAERRSTTAAAPCMADAARCRRSAAHTEEAVAAVKLAATLTGGSSFVWLRFAQ